MTITVRLENVSGRASTGVSAAAGRCSEVVYCDMMSSGFLSRTRKLRFVGLETLQRNMSSGQVDSGKDSKVQVMKKGEIQDNVQDVGHAPQ